MSEDILIPDEEVLEGVYLPISDIFNGIILLGDVKKWLSITGIVPKSIEHGVHHMIGVRGFYIHY